MSTSGTTNDMEDPPSKYTVEELGQMMFDANIRHAALDKKLMSQQCDLEGFMRRQEATNRKIEDSLALLLDPGHGHHTKPPDRPPNTTATRGWHPPPSILQPPHGVVPEPLVKVKPEPPRFNGENAPDWIRKNPKIL